MKLQKYIPAQFTLLLIGGIILGYYFYFPLLVLRVLSIGLIFLLFFLKYRSNKVYRPLFLFNIVTYFLFFTIGIITITIQNPKRNPKHYTQQIDINYSSNNLIFLEITQQLKPTPYNNSFYAKTIAINHKKYVGKIILYTSKKTNFITGQQVFVNTNIQPISPPKNPHQFNYKNFLKKQQIFHKIEVNPTNYKLYKIHKSIGYYLFVWRKKIAHYFVKNGLKKEELAIVKALILGEKQFISKELQQSYANAGVIHILAISGLHIGIIWIIISFLFQPFRRFKYGKFIFSFSIISLLWLYALFTGMSPSVVRSVTMFSAITIGNNLNRPTNVYQNLIFSMFFLLLINPSFLFSVGFQMSYIAVFSIVWIQPKIYGLWNPSLKIVDYFWKLTSVSVAAQIGVLPLSLFYFHQFPGLFLLANIVIIPLLGILLFIGFFLTFLGVLNVSAPVLVSSYGNFIDFINRFVYWIASKESFLFKNISFSFVKMILFYLFILFFFYWVEKKHFNRFIAVLLVFISIQITFIFEKYQTSKKQELLIFNTPKKSLIGIRNKNIFTLQILDSASYQSIITPYITNENIKIKKYKRPEKYFLFHKNYFLIIDSLNVYKYSKSKSDIILLQHSPKVNLERVIHLLSPKLIIADNSNYKNYKIRWKNTCSKQNTPFYDIAQKGAFYISK